MHCNTGFQAMNSASTAPVECIEQIDLPPDGPTRLARLALDDGPRALIVVRAAAGLRVFLNSCPHRGVRLDWMPGRVMDENGTTLQCATHGARFALDSGRCLEGPCLGRSLVAVPVVERDGRLWLEAGVAALPLSAIGH